MTLYLLCFCILFLSPQGHDATPLLSDSADSGVLTAVDDNTALPLSDSEEIPATFANRLLGLSDSDEVPAGASGETRKEYKKEAKKAEKKAIKEKKKVKKAKKEIKELKKEIKKAKKKKEAPRRPEVQDYEQGLEADLLHKDLTTIPRKKLLQMAKVCKTRKQHYQFELARCVQENDSDRRACLDTFNRVKDAVELRCTKLKELFTKIFKFIEDLRQWSSNGSTSKSAYISKEKAGNQFLGLMDDMRNSGTTFDGSKRKQEGKKLKNLIKKSEKSTQKSGKKTKKAVKSVERAMKKGIKEVKGSKAKKKFLKKVVKKLKQAKKKNSKDGKSNKVLRKVLKKAKKTLKKVKKEVKKKKKGTKGLKKLLKKIRKDTKYKAKKKGLKNLLKKIKQDSPKKSKKSRMKKLLRVLAKDDEGGSSKKAVKKLIKKIDRKVEEKKILKKLKRRAEYGGDKKSSASGSDAKEAGRTFIDWLTHKKGSRQKLHDWVKAKLEGGGIKASSSSSSSSGKKSNKKKIKNAIPTSKKTAKKLAKKLGKKLDKMEIKGDLTKKQQKMVGKMEKCKECAKDFAKKKKVCEKMKGKETAKDCLKELKKLEEKLKKCKKLPKKVKKLNKKEEKKKKEKKAEKKAEKKEEKAEKKAEKKEEKAEKKAEKKKEKAEVKKIKKEQKKEVKKLKKLVKKEKKQIEKAKQQGVKKAAKVAKKAAKAAKKEMKAEVKDMKKAVKKATKAAKKAAKKGEAGKEAKKAAKSVKKSMKKTMKKLKKEVKKAKKAAGKAEKAEEKKEEKAKKSGGGDDDSDCDKKKDKKKSEGGDGAEKKDDKKAAKAEKGGVDKWVKSDEQKPPTGEVKQEIKKAMKKIEQDEKKKLDESTSAGNKVKSSQGKESQGDNPNGFLVEKKKRKDSDAPADGSMTYSRKPKGAAKSGKKSAKKSSGGGASSESSDSSGGKASGRDAVYDFFKRGPNKKDPEFGFHRSKMKNYKASNHDSAVAESESDSSDWTDFGSRRNLAEEMQTGPSEDGRQQVKDEKKMKEMKNAVKDVKKKMKQKMRELDSELKDGGGESAGQVDFAEPKNLGSLVVRKVENPDEVRLQIAKLEGKLKSLDEKITEHRKYMMKHLKKDDDDGDYKDRFKGVNKEIDRERRKVVGRMQRKYKDLQLEASKGKVLQKGYEKRIHDLEGSFAAFRAEMNEKLHQKQNNEIMKRLDGLQSKFHEQKMKEKALRFVGKMAQEIGQKVNGGGKSQASSSDAESSSDDSADSGSSDWGGAENFVDTGNVFDYFKGRIPRTPKSSAKPNGNKAPANPQKKAPVNQLNTDQAQAITSQAENFATRTAKFLTGEFIDHRCRKRLRQCKESLQKHLQVLRACEKSKEGDEAPCWKEVHRTNKKVMRDFDRCREIKKSCNGKSGDVDDMEQTQLDPCRFLDEFDPFREKKCEELKANEKKGFPNRIQDDVYTMTEEFDQQLPHLQKHAKHAHAKKNKTAAKPPPSGKQIIIKGGVQHFYLHPGSNQKADGQPASHGGKGGFTLHPDDDVEDDTMNDGKTDLADPYLYDFFKADALHEPEPEPGFNKPFGYHIEKTEDDADKSLTGRAYGWASNKFRQIGQFFGRRRLREDPISC